MLHTHPVAADFRFEDEAYQHTNPPRKTIKLPFRLDTPLPTLECPFLFALLDDEHTDRPYPPRIRLSRLPTL